MAKDANQKKLLLLVGRIGQCIGPACNHHKSNTIQQKGLMVTQHAKCWPFTMPEWKFKPLTFQRYFLLIGKGLEHFSE
jgi:hypothetical protein